MSNIEIAINNSVDEYFNAVLNDEGVLKDGTDPHQELSNIVNDYVGKLEFNYNFIGMCLNVSPPMPYTLPNPLILQFKNSSLTLTQQNSLTFWSSIIDTYVLGLIPNIKEKTGVVTLTAFIPPIPNIPFFEKNFISYLEKKPEDAETTYEIKGVFKIIYEEIISYIDKYVIPTISVGNTFTGNAVYTSYIFNI